ncbi:MAG: hypothetical protein HRU09_13795 [Oligoflexales bacterium]|nr:hypothetical protein [Oligoflexales bacterium]
MNSIKQYIGQHIFGEHGSELVFWNQLDPQEYKKNRIKQDIFRVTQYLKDLGIREHETVAMILPTEPGFVSCL